MAFQKLNWITVDEVVNLYLDQSEQSNHKYYKCWNLAFAGMEELGLDFFYRIKSVKLPVNANKTVTLPADYMQYSKVGWLNGMGEVVPLMYNNNLTTYADLLPDRLAKTQANSLNLYSISSPLFYNYWDGYGYGNLYGLNLSAIYGGQFKIDKSNGVILLDNFFGWPDLVMEYVANPAEGEIYYVPLQFKKALMWYIAWNDIAMLPNTRRGSLGDKEQRKRNYFNERRLAIARYEPFDIEQAYQWNVQSQRLVVKV